MKREVPSRIPWVFPLVGYGDNVAVEHVKPVFVTVFSLPSEIGIGTVRFHPLMNVEVIVLLVPQHTRQSLAHDPGFLFAYAWRSERRVKLIALPPAHPDYLVKRTAERVTV